MSDSESTEDDFEEVMFTVQEIELEVAVKVLIVLMWLLIETVGNGMLFGLIHFDLWAGDPLKRRISDQVGWIFFFTYSVSNLVLHLQVYWEKNHKNKVQVSGAIFQPFLAQYDPNEPSTTQVCCISFG